MTSRYLKEMFGKLFRLHGRISLSIAAAVLLCSPALPPNTNIRML
jgi:hypothetical protein